MAAAASSPSIRLARRTDLPALASLLYESFAVQSIAPTEGMDDRSVPVPRSWLEVAITKGRLAADIEQRMTPWDWSRHAQIVAEDENGRAVGFVEVWGEDAMALYNETAQTPQPVLFNLCVSSDARRGGVARMLVQRCEEECRSWGDPELYLKVRDDNPAASRLYGGAGFQVLEQRDPPELPAWQERWKGDGGKQPLQLLRKELTRKDGSTSTVTPAIPARRPQEFEVTIDSVLAYKDREALIWFVLLILRNTNRLTPTYRVLPALAAIATWAAYYGLIKILSAPPG